MDKQKLTELLRASFDPNPEQRKLAEEKMALIHEIIGFAPTILQIVMQNTLDQPVREAGAVYLKNLVNSSWIAHDKKRPGNPFLSFSIHEQDRAMVRSTIVKAILLAPELIREHLLDCVNHITKNDFTKKWAETIKQYIRIFLINPDSDEWKLALVIIYVLVKKYEYIRSKELITLIKALNILLPIIYQLMVNLFNDQSEESVLLQKQILKIYFALIQYSLPLDLINHDTVSQWMILCLQIADQPVPDCSHLDDDYKSEFPYWKLKKWALHIILRVFERYGRIHNVVNKKYEKFAQWFLPTFGKDIINMLLKILEQYPTHVYISPRVLTDILSYLKNAVNNPYMWQLIKPHTVRIIQEVIFPIMSFTNADQKLWDADPYKYIRVKFNICKDYATPLSAAQSLLYTLCKKRNWILLWAMQIITSPNADNKQKDGAFHMIGTLADILLKNIPRKELETMLKTYVFPEFKNPAGHLRARVCWVLHHFCDLAVNNLQVLTEIMRLITDALLNDRELPVKVEAAVSLRKFISSQNEAAKYVEGEINDISKELLTVIRETKNKDLPIVTQKIVLFYFITDQLLPVAKDICQHLATTFRQMLESEERSVEEANAAKGLLDTIETLLTVVKDHPHVIINLHPIVINVVDHIIQNNINDFYEETFSLLYVLTSDTISPEMWQLLELVRQVFKKDGINYFINIIPALLNYVTVDTLAFLSDQNRLLSIFDMCKIMLTSKPGEDQECRAAKLLEVIILQCNGQIDYIIPHFVELAVTRLRRGVHSSELCTMCLQVVIAALYYDPKLLLSILEKMSQPNNEPISSYFIWQWLLNTQCFFGIHDRKLSVLGWCALISLGDDKPPVLIEVGNKILPALILLFDGLKRAYEAITQPLVEEEEGNDDDDWEESKLSSDEDEQSMSPNYLPILGKFAKNKAKIELRDEESGVKEVVESGDLNDTGLESYKTPIDGEDVETSIDEYWRFKEVITLLSKLDQVWYSHLTSGLTPKQEEELHDVVITAVTRKIDKELKLLEKQIGFAFSQ